MFLQLGLWQFQDCSTDQIVIPVKALMAIVMNANIVGIQRIEMVQRICTSLIEAEFMKNG